MITELQKFDGIVLCQGSNGELQAWRYVRKGSQTPPPLQGFGGHIDVDDEPASLLDLKIRELA